MVLQQLQKRRRRRRIAPRGASCQAQTIHKMAAAATATATTLAFEVFGKVQGAHLVVRLSLRVGSGLTVGVRTGAGVFFRKSAKERADALSVHGWIRNTPSGTVEGEIQGPVAKVASMREWLTTKGPPRGRIDRAEFRPVASPKAYSEFAIIRD